MTSILHDLEDTYDTLVTNGMFRNREHNGQEISGSDADTCRYDAADYAECAERCGLKPVPVDARRS